MNWTIGDKQELRVKLQALGLDAPLKQAFRVAADGTPIPTSEPEDDFSLSQLGFQIRYRYELAPLSDLYVVYGRGGGVFNEFSEDPNTLLRDAFELRDAEQFLIKISYRFERLSRLNETRRRLPARQGLVGSANGVLVGKPQTNPGLRGPGRVFVVAKVQSERCA